MAPLFVALSIFIKGRPLAYPGKGLMAGRGEDHAVTFTTLKMPYCWSLPKVLGLKAPLFRPLCPLQRAVKCWQVAYMQTYTKLRKEQFLQTRLASEPSLCVSPPPKPTPWRMQHFVQRGEREAGYYPVLHDWWPLPTVRAATVTASPSDAPEASFWWMASEGLLWCWMGVGAVSSGSQHIQWIDYAVNINGE